MTAEAPALVCRECWEEFDVESSPDVEHCQRCAETHPCHEGFTDITDQAPRLFVGRDRGEA